MNADPYKGAKTGAIALIVISVLFIGLFLVAFVTFQPRSFTGSGDGADHPETGIQVGDR